MSLTFGRIVVARLAGRRRAIAPLLGAFTLAIALLVALPETAYLCSVASFQAMLSSLPRSTSGVQVVASNLESDEAITQFAQDVAHRAANGEHGYLRQTSFRIESTFFPISSHNGRPLAAPDPGNVLEFAVHEHLQSQSDLIAGSWTGAAAQGTLSATLSEEAANLAQALPGDRLCVASGSRLDAVCITVVGVWRPRDAGSADWVGDVRLAAEAEVSRADLLSLAALNSAGYQATAVLSPDLALIKQSDPAAVQDSLAGLGPILGRNELYRDVLTGLDAAVQTFNERSRVAAFALDLITAQLWIVGLYCLVFLIGVRLEQDRDAVAVWRTRGWSRRLAATLLSVEVSTIALIALLPGLLIGFLLAVGITRTVYPSAYLAVGTSASAEAPVVIIGLLAMWAIVIVLAAAAARVSVVRTRADASRPQARWWNSRWAAIAAVALAIPILAEARVLGDARVRAAGTGLPFDLLLPGAGMALIAFAGVAVIPRAATAFARRAHGVASRLAALQLARASSRQQRLSLLVSAAVALAVLAAAYSGTAARNVSDRAAYAAGADLRVITGGDRPDNLESLPAAGATAKSEVFRAYGTVGSNQSQVQVLGVDPTTFSAVAWTRPGMMSPDLPILMRRLVDGEKGGTLLPEAATGLSIWVRGEHTGGSLTALLTDSDLESVTVDFGALDFDGWRLLAASFRPARFAGQLRLRHLTLTPVAQEGTVAFSDLEATTGSGPKQIYAFDELQVRGFPAWWQSDGARGAKLQNVTVDDQFPHDGHLTGRVFLSPGWLPVTINPPAFEDVRDGNFFQLVTQRIPLLVSTSVLATNRLKVGDSVAVRMGGYSVNGLIAGAFDYFPTLYGDGLVFSLAPLLQVIGFEGDPRPWPSELWVSGRVDEGALSAAPGVASVVSRADLENASSTDPIGAAGRANLILGFAAACILAVAAFAIYFAFAASARTSEYAVLQANGLSSGQIERSLLIEEVLILVLATALGLVIGAALALVLLPDLQVSTSQADTIPPTVLGLNPWLAIGGIAITLGACLIAGRAAARSSRVAEIMTELRALG